MESGFYIEQTSFLGVMERSARKKGLGEVNFEGASDEQREGGVGPRSCPEQRHSSDSDPPSPAFPGSPDTCPWFSKGLP